MKKYQQGLSLGGMVAVCVVIIIIAVLAAKIVPAVSEYRQVVKTVALTARDANSDKVIDEGRVRNIFSRHSQSQYINNVSENDVTIRRAGDGIIVSVSYGRKIPLFLNASLLLEFNTESTGRGEF